MRTSVGAAGRIYDARSFAVMLLAVPLYLLSAHLFSLSAEFAGAAGGGSAADAPAAVDAERAPGWREIDANRIGILYEDGVDLRAVERRLRKRIYIFGQSAPEDLEVEGKIGYRLNALFSRARDILDMHPQMPKLKIRVFKSGDSLFREYVNMTGSSRESSAGAGNITAFYVQAEETIYTSEETVTDSVMAHEIAHAVIDHYFMFIPSSKVAEVLASYVDMHISD